MNLVLRVVVAAALTVPIFLGLSMIDPLARWVGSAQAWDRLAPLFRLFDANGIEREEDVLMGVLFAVSFVMASLLTWAGGAAIRRARTSA